VRVLVVVEEVAMAGRMSEVVVFGGGVSDARKSDQQPTGTREVGGPGDSLT
jgi:hypothetical protein